MALFSGPARAGQLSAARAQELRSCIRPLVPYHEVVAPKSDFMRRRRLQHKSRPEFSTVDDLMEVNAQLVSGERVDGEKVDRLVQWPPSSILSLARRSVLFGGDPAAVLSQLSPTRYPVHFPHSSFTYFENHLFTFQLTPPSRMRLVNYEPREQSLTVVETGAGCGEYHCGSLLFDQVRLRKQVRR